jgi:hypothetical protein
MITKGAHGMPDESACLVVTPFGYETAIPCIHDDKRTLNSWQVEEHIYALNA